MLTLKESKRQTHYVSFPFSTWKLFKNYIYILFEHLPRVRTQTRLILLAIFFTNWFYTTRLKNLKMILKMLSYQRKYEYLQIFPEIPFVKFTDQSSSQPMSKLNRYTIVFHAAWRSKRSITFSVTKPLLKAWSDFKPSRHGITRVGNAHACELPFRPKLRLPHVMERWLNRFAITNTFRTFTTIAETVLLTSKQWKSP